MPVMSQDAISPSVEQFRARARAWLSEHTFELPEDLAERFERQRQWQTELHDAGYIGVAWPTRFGGRGLTQAHQLAFFEELASAQLPPPAALVGLEVLGPTFVRLGTDAQRAEILPPLLRGDIIWCQGFSEPGAGSDLAGLQTRALRRDGGFVLNGQKVWTSWAQFSQWCAVLARTDGTVPAHQGITCFLVDMSTPGFRVRPITQMTEEQEFSEVFLDDVWVPESAVFGGVGNGWNVAMDVLASERGSFAIRRRAEVTAAFERGIAQLIDGAAGDAVLDDVDLAHLGRCSIALSVMQAQARQTAARLQRNEGPTPFDSVDKLVITTMEQRVHSAMMELLGADVMDPGSRPHGLNTAQWTREYLYSRAATIYGGTAQIQRNIVAQRLLGLPRSR